MRSAGEILLESGLIGRDQLERASAQQKTSGGKLSLIESLVEMGTVSEIDIAVALSDHLNLPYLPLRSFSFNSDLLKEIPETLVQKCQFLPVDKSKGFLSIVMADPTNREACSEIEKALKCKIQVWLSVLSELRNAVAECYGGRPKRS